MTQRHAFSWSGQIPCTGVYRCLYCGKVADAHPLDYSKVDREEECPHDRPHDRRHIRHDRPSDRRP